MMTPFRLPAFRRLWYSSVAIMAAQGVERTLTAWLALQTGGGAFAVGLIFAARMLPSLLFGLTAGTLADQMSRVRQLVLVASLSALFMIGFGIWIGIGTPQVWQVVIFALAAGCIQVFDTPARQALVVDTVPKETAQRALAQMALGTRVSSAIGALSAGVFLPIIGITASYLIVALAYAASVGYVSLVRVDTEKHATTAPTSFSQAFRDGAKLVLSVPAVGILMIAGLTCEIFAFSHMSALPLFAQDVLKTGPAGLGVLNAAISIGGALAVIMLSVLPDTVRRQPLLSGIFITYGLSIVALAISRDLISAVVIVVLLGFCAAAFDVLQQTLIQLSVPDEQRGRAMGIWLLGIGSAPVGHLEMGALIALIGVPAALMINGSLTLVSAALFLLIAPTYRWRPRLRARSN